MGELPYNGMSPSYNHGLTLSKDIGTRPPTPASIGATDPSNVVEKNDVQDPLCGSVQIRKSRTSAGVGDSITDDEESDEDSDDVDDDDEDSDEGVVREKKKSRRTIAYIEDYTKRRTRFNNDSKRLLKAFLNLTKRTDCVGILYLRRSATRS